VLLEQTTERLGSTRPAGRQTGQVHLVANSQASTPSAGLPLLLRVRQHFAHRLIVRRVPRPGRGGAVPAMIADGEVDAVRNQEARPLEVAVEQRMTPRHLIMWFAICSTRREAEIRDSQPAQAICAATFLIVR
jgi:hypothetical protein